MLDGVGMHRQPKFATYSVLPLGVIARAFGWRPTVIAAPGESVANVIGVTVPAM